jgi:hypothetical protein
MKTRLHAPYEKRKVMTEKGIKNRLTSPLRLYTNICPNLKNTGAKNTVTSKGGDIKKGQKVGRS